MEKYPLVKKRKAKQKNLIINIHHAQRRIKAKADANNINQTKPKQS